MSYSNVLANVSVPANKNHNGFSSIFRSGTFYAIVETLLFLSAVVLLDRYFGEGTRFMGALLHPFWIIVLVITVQYGVFEAVIAAGLASAFLLIGNLPEQTLTETMYEYIRRVSFLPFLWFITALVLGSIRSRQLNERKSLLERLFKAEDSLSTIVRGYNSVKKAKEHLELRLAEERCSVFTVYNLAKSLETVDSSDYLSEVSKLIRVALNPEKFSLYRLENGSMQLEFSHGWAKHETYNRHFYVSNVLVQNIVKKRRILSISNIEDENILGDQGVMAGPIIHEKTGKIYGMLKIEEMGFMNLGMIRTHETFGIVCEWIGRVYDKLEQQEQISDDRIKLLHIKNTLPRQAAYA